MCTDNKVCAEKGEGEEKVSGEGTGVEKGFGESRQKNWEGFGVRRQKKKLEGFGVRRQKKKWEGFGERRQRKEKVAEERVEQVGLGKKPLVTAGSAQLK